MLRIGTDSPSLALQQLAIVTFPVRSLTARQLAFSEQVFFSVTVSF
jgi:hypothetical protein